MKRNPLLLYDAQIMNRAGRAMGNIDKILKGLTQALDKPTRRSSVSSGKELGIMALLRYQ